MKILEKKGDEYGSQGFLDHFVAVGISLFLLPFRKLSHSRAHHCFKCSLEVRPIVVRVGCTGSLCSHACPIGPVCALERSIWYGRVNLFNFFFMYIPTSFYFIDARGFFKFAQGFPPLL
jgi:hypothetical protein